MRFKKNQKKQDEALVTTDCTDKMPYFFRVINVVVLSTLRLREVHGIKKKTSDSSVSLGSVHQLCASDAA